MKTKKKWWTRNPACSTITVSVEEQNSCRVFQVAAAVRRSRNRMVRSGYVPFGGKVDERERQEVVRIRSATEECEDDFTESPQYYDYGEEASRRKERPFSSISHFFFF